jgi:hypothetical protein
MHLKGQTLLLEIVQALGSTRGFARGLNCRQQQRDQNPNNRDYDQELDKGERRIHTAAISLRPLQSARKHFKHGKASLKKRVSTL